MDLEVKYKAEVQTVQQNSTDRLAELEVQHQTLTEENERQFQQRLQEDHMLLKVTYYYTHTPLYICAVVN